VLQPAVEEGEEVVSNCEVVVIWLRLCWRLDANTLYYTLSTIAQTLAGALAVLVAIVLFNFSRVNDTLGNWPVLDPATPPSTRWRSRPPRRS
jgi:hypothetical protein